MGGSQFQFYACICLCMCIHTSHHQVKCTQGGQSNRLQVYVCDTQTVFGHAHVVPQPLFMINFEALLYFGRVWL